MLLAFRRLWHRPWSISFKIGIAISLLVVVVLATHMILNDPRKLILQQKHLEGSRLGRIVVSIVDKEMFEEEPWRVQDHLSLAASPEDVYSIRLLDRSGRVRYASNEEELGKTLVREEHDQCRHCHGGQDGGFPQETMWVNAEGERIYSLHRSLADQETCLRCHEAGSESLGKLLIDLHITEPDLDALSMRDRLATSGIILVALTILCVLVLVRFLVSRPIGRLMAVTREIEAGNFDVSFPSASRDEIGELARSFQRMSGPLGSLINEQEQTIQDRTAELRRSQQLVIHQEKMAAMGRLTAGVAHEVGNPLASISGMVQLLQRTAKEERTRERAKEIDTHVQRISRIVRDLVNFYRPKHVASEWVDVRGVIETALGIARYDRDMNAIEVTTSLEPGYPMVRVVEDHLLQVVLNLIFNAVDAMPRGGALQISARFDATGIEILVRDNGEGVAKEDAKKLFDPFFTTKPPGKGTGLGLWISYSLARQWGGTIEIDSPSGGGTVANIRIPTVEEGAHREATSTHHR